MSFQVKWTDGGVTLDYQAGHISGSGRPADNVNRSAMAGMLDLWRRFLGAVRATGDVPLQEARSSLRVELRSTGTTKDLEVELENDGPQLRSVIRYNPTTQTYQRDQVNAWKVTVGQFVQAIDAIDEYLRLTE